MAEGYYINKKTRTFDILTGQSSYACRNGNFLMARGYQSDLITDPSHDQEIPIM